MSNIFFTANTIITGENAIQNASNKLCSFGKKALIISGKTVSTLPCFSALIKTLDSLSIKYEIFNDITGEPDNLMIEKGVECYKKASCDFLIGIGGGSPIDAMKAIAVILSCGGKISDYMGKEINGNLPKMVAIPTTAGTGSEVTQFTIITDTETQVKMLLKGACLMPDLAIVDGQNTISSPKSVTASTALDALTHAVEAYTSKKAQPLTDSLCISAIKRIFKYLPIAYDNPNDIKARNELSIAALEAGIAINNSSVTIVHGMSRPIGALFHVPHGTSNAMLLYNCMNFVCDGAYERFADMAKAIDINASQDDKTLSLLFIYKLKELCLKCQIPTLESYGIDKNTFFENIDKMADDALKSGSPANTLKPIDKNNIIYLYKSLW